MSIFPPRDIAGVPCSELSPGDEVDIHYFFTGLIRAKVIEVEPMSRYGKQTGWVTVEQITDFEDHDHKPRYEAWHGYMQKVTP